MKHEIKFMYAEPPVNYLRSNHFDACALFDYKTASSAMKKNCKLNKQVRHKTWCQPKSSLEFQSQISSNKDDIIDLEDRHRYSEENKAFICKDVC